MKLCLCKQNIFFPDKKYFNELNASGSCALQSACWWRRCKLHVCWGGGVGAASLLWVCESLLA